MYMSSDIIFTIFILWGIPQAVAQGEFSLAKHLLSTPLMREKSSNALYWEAAETVKETGVGGKETED